MCWSSAITNLFGIALRTTGESMDEQVPNCKSPNEKALQFQIKKQIKKLGVLATFSVTYVVD
jgi:hypothetical protein